MDPVSSGLTIVSAVWTLSVRLRDLINNLKTQRENVRKLEHKAETLAVIIQQVQAACEPHEGKSIPIDEAEENVRRTIRNVTSRCRDDLDEFVKELSNLLFEKKTGRFRMGLVLRTWRMQVATPTFARIEKSIEGHEFSLQLLLSVLHGRNLDATRTLMCEKLNAIHTSNQEMRVMLELLALSPDRLSHNESTVDFDNAAFYRRDTDATLVDLQTASDIDINGFTDDDSRQLHQLFMRIFGAWLNQRNIGDKRISETPDLLFDLTNPKAEASTLHIEHAEPETFNPKVVPDLTDPMWEDRQKYILPDHMNENGTKVMPETRRQHIERSWSREESPPSPLTISHPSEPRPRRRSSPPIGPTEIPLSLSPTPTRASHISHTTSPSQSSQHESTEVSSISNSEAPLPSETASRELLRAVSKNGEDINWLNVLIDSDIQPDLEYRERECSDRNKKSRGMTPLLLAVKLGKVKTMKLLLSKGSNIEAKDSMEMTPFILAASLDKVEIMKELISAGANVRAKDKEERTALHVAINKAARNSTSFLLELHSDDNVPMSKKPDLDAGDKSERTPLHYCAKMDNLESLAKMLIEQGACQEARDVAKMTPAYYAIRHRKYFIVELLLNNGADFTEYSLKDTSDEIRKLINRRSSQACDVSDSTMTTREGDRERSKSEVDHAPGRSRKDSWLSAKTSKLIFRRSSAKH